MMKIDHWCKMAAFSILIISMLNISCGPMKSGPISPDTTENISQEQQPISPGCDIPTFYVGPHEFLSSYDQIEISPYRGNLSYPGQLSTANMTLGNGADALHVEYRSNIDSFPGQVRYNIINIWIPGKSMESENVTFRLANIYPDVTIRRSVVINADSVGHYRPALKIDISSAATPGYYDYEVLTFLNGKYRGIIPFRLHIMNYPPGYVSDNISSSSNAHRPANNVLIALPFAPPVDQEMGLECVMYSDTGCDNATAWLVMPESVSVLTGNTIFSGKIEKGNWFLITKPIIFHKPGHYEILALAQFHCNPDNSLHWGLSFVPITVGYDKSLIGTEP